MTNILTIIITLVSFTIPLVVTQCAGIWQKCGGKNYQGSKCCQAGGTCTYLNDYYSQCKPSPKPANGCQNDWYSQCGGKDFNGQTCCPAGTTCVKSDDYYSQCRPADTTQQTTTVCPNTIRSQCGGRRYSGPTCCPAGTTCTYRNRRRSVCKKTTSTTSTQSSTTSTRSTTQNTQTTSTTRRTTTPNNGEEFNFVDVLDKSLTFFDGQKSGKISGTINAFSWRGDSALQDGADNNVDLTGGYYDAGDHMKFALPMSYSMYMLALSGLHHEDTYRSSQKWNKLLATIKWGTDYFLKCHTDKYEFYGQVGLGSADHSYWGPPETMTMNRPSFKITKSQPGSEVAGSVAATFALASMLFKNDNPSYSSTLLTHAREMFDFATEYQGSYVNAIPDARNYYNSFSGYKDEQLLGALALYWATQESQYETYINANSGNLVTSSLTWAPGWDDASYVNVYLIWKLLGNTQAKNTFEKWANHFMNNVRKTPQGLIYLTDWGSARYPVAAGFLLLSYVDSNPNLAQSKVNEYEAFALRQMNYVLGDNNDGFSYLVGFGNKYPQHTHHRAAHGSTTNNINNPATNKHVNYMLVGGPDSNDNYEDNIHSYSQSEGACDMQVGLIGLAAALVKRQ